MKVCLLNDSFPPIIDGVANTVMNYASVLTEVGDQVTVATPRYPDADYSGYPYKVVPYDSINTTKIVSGYRAGNPFDTDAIEQMRLDAPDIIHSHCPVASSIMARLLRNQTASPIVFTYHTKFDVDIARAVKAKTLQEGAVRFLVSNISVADEVWTVSKGAGENLRSLGYEGQYRVMNNGVDFAKGRVDDATVKEVTSGYDLPEDLPIYLFVGRLMNYKGLPLILDALRIVSDQDQDFRMVFIGNGADKEGLIAKSKELGFSVDITDETGNITSHVGSGIGKVIFTGAIHDRTALRAWNTRADLFLFPSTYDTNGIVVREAAACGLASVLIADSCASEGITDKRNGFLIEETPASMAALLIDLHGDKEIMHQAGQHAMDEIYISWHDAVLVARERYAQILDEKARFNFPLRRISHTDALIEAAGNLYDFSRSIHDAADNIQEFSENIKDSAKDALDFSDSLRESADSLQELTESVMNTSRLLSEGMMSNFYDAKSSLERGRDKWERGKDKLEQKTQEFHQEVKNAGESMKLGFHELGETLKDNIKETNDKLNNKFFGDKD